MCHSNQRFWSDNFCSFSPKHQQPIAQVRYKCFFLSFKKSDIKRKNVSFVISCTFSTIIFPLNKYINLDLDIIFQKLFC